MSRTIKLGVTPYAGYYDAASFTRERDYGRPSALVHEDAIFNGAVRYITIGRIRREIRNNPYLSGLVRKFSEALGSSTLRSRTPDLEYNQEKEKFWSRWARTVTMAGDSLRSLEEIVWSELVVAGEVFIILNRSGLVQVIPSELCGSSLGYFENSDNGNREINGIIYNRSGRPLYYRFGKTNGVGGIDYSLGNSSLVPAQFVRHLYRKDRILMGRGLPWLLPSISTARDLYEITRAKSKQIKDVVSMFGYISKQQDSAGLSGIGSPMGYTSEDSYSETEERIETEDSPADKEDNTKATSIKMEPGTFIELEPGEKIEQLNNSYQAGDYKELIMLMLHAISTPIGLPVELWFSGLGDVNYSGFKGLGTQWKSARERYLELIREGLLEPLHDWRIAKAQNELDLSVPKTGTDVQIDWRWRRAAVLDDEKQAKSSKTRLESGESCLADIWEENGEYAEDVIERRRSLYVKMFRASNPSSELKDDEIEVPMSFLLFNKLEKQATPAEKGEGKEDAANDENNDTRPATGESE